MWLVAFANEHFSFEKNFNLKSESNRLPSMCSQLDFFFGGGGVGGRVALGGNQQQVAQLPIISSAIH